MLYPSYFKSLYFSNGDISLSFKTTEPVCHSPPQEVNVSAAIRTDNAL